MIDLKYFPPEMNLFESDSAWRMKCKMAIVNDAEKSSLDHAEVILSLNGFIKTGLEEGLLERYFSQGDEDELTEHLHTRAKRSI